MKTIGIMMWTCGLLLAAYAMFIFEPTINGSTINFDLQQRQMMMLIAGCVLFAVGVVLHAMSMYGGPSTKSGDGQPADGSGKKGPTIQRIAFARQLGISEADDGYQFGGQFYADIEDAIKAADPDKWKAMPDFGKVGW